MSPNSTDSASGASRQRFRTSTVEIHPTHGASRPGKGDRLKPRTHRPPTFWNNRQQLHAIAGVISGAGWLVAFLVLVVGSVMAASSDAEVAFLLRAALAGAVLALTSALDWLIRRYADHAAAC